MLDLPQLDGAPLRTGATAQGLPIGRELLTVQPLFRAHVRDHVRLYTALLLLVASNRAPRSTTKGCALRLHLRIRLPSSINLHIYLFIRRRCLRTSTRLIPGANDTLCINLRLLASCRSAVHFYLFS